MRTGSAATYVDRTKRGIVITYPHGHLLHMARVNIDYHIAVDGHFYSTPHALVHEQVEVRKTSG